jgi:hypothetical protein
MGNSNLFEPIRTDAIAPIYEIASSFGDELVTSFSCARRKETISARQPLQRFQPFSRGVFALTGFIAAE